jgi:DUF1680 family protein
VTIPHAQGWLERNGSIANFRPGAERQGLRFSDSDVHKLLEAMTWEAGRTGDPALTARTEQLTTIVAEALEPDGYLNTYWRERERYSDLPMGHELYCAGHLIQAAVAAARTGGPGALVELGRAVADHVAREFGPDGPRQGIDGHPEPEMALVELYRVTGERRYLDTARAMIDRRGHGTLGDAGFGLTYYQDDVPVREATVMRGHAVRALYLLAGAADVATETGDAELLAAVERQWANTIARRTYITGGMGARYEDEGFGDDFELPDDAYSETCAGVAAVMLAWRLLLATGDHGYADQLERTLHNVVAAGVSADGTAFSYVNPLQATPDTVARYPWFDCACCPPNVARLLASLGAYAATADDTGVQLHLYAAGELRTDVATLAVRTGYPWDGEIAIEVRDTRPQPWTLSLRVPPWAEGATLDHRPVAPGVSTLRRTWRRGDAARLSLPVAPRLTGANGRVAVERGPLVYCLQDDRLIPYFTWGNRGPAAMRVWLLLETIAAGRSTIPL